MVFAEMLREHYSKRDARKKADIAKGFEEGKKEGISEGRKVGLAQGADMMGRKWAEWNYRRLVAQERGEDFDEPPPNFQSSNKRKLTVHYDAETDTLSLRCGVAVRESEDVAEHLIADFDDDGDVVGFTLEHAGEVLKTDISTLGRLFSGESVNAP